MTKTLEEQIAERKQQALDKAILEKAERVEAKLGRDFNYAANSLAIHHDVQKSRSWDRPDMHTVTISYEEETVFIARHHSRGFIKGRAWGAPYIDSYIPGEWEKKLEAAYAQVEKIEKKEAAEEKIRNSKAGQDKANRAPWGL